MRHEGYRRLVAARPCCYCGIEGYSQCAHVNAGKAKGMKADDRMSMALCHVGANDCHGRFDRYELFSTRFAHQANGEMWALETRTAIRQEGNWPANLEQME